MILGCFGCQLMEQRGYVYILWSPKFWNMYYVKHMLPIYNNYIHI